jgi:hypothetical protein
LQGQQQQAQLANLAVGQQLQRQRQPAQQTLDQLALVLRLVPLQQRIGSCSLVCRSWRAAAALATAEIELKELNTQQQADALCAWLLRYGSNGLRHLNVQSCIQQEHLAFSIPWQQLAELQSLRLKVFALPAAAAHATHVEALTALTSLRLSCYNIQSYAFAWQLRLLTGLRSLKLFPMGNLDDAGGAVHAEFEAAGFRDAIAEVLPQLVQLTCLSLERTGMDGTALEAVSHLTQLQRLHLTDECRDFEDDEGQLPLHIQHLPSSLTQLKLENSGVSCIGDGPNNGQQRQQLRELRLSFAGSRFQLEAVAHMTSLTHVCIHDALDAENFAGLLDGLSQLQQLQRIEVVAANEDAQPLPPAASYAALTASSHLTTLLLSDCCMQSVAARHMFAAGRRVPHLQQLEITPHELRLLGFSLTMYTVDEVRDYSLVLQPGYAAQLVACCPNLRSLSLLWAPMSADASSLQPLTLLTHLTSLRVGGDGWGNQAAIDVLSRMTGEHQSMPLAEGNATFCVSFVQQRDSCEATSICMCCLSLMCAVPVLGSPCNGITTSGPLVAYRDR